MSFVNKYLSCTYEDGARGPHKWDCFGLARHVRHEHYGKLLLPSLGDVSNKNPKLFTKTYREQSSGMRECGPEDGAICAVFRGSLCMHVAVVVSIENRLMILEISSGRNATIMSVDDFESQYAKVKYYNDH